MDVINYRFSINHKRALPAFFMTSSLSYSLKEKSRYLPLANSYRFDFNLPDLPVANQNWFYPNDSKSQ